MARSSAHLVLRTGPALAAAAPCTWPKSLRRIRPEPVFLKTLLNKHPEFLHSRMGFGFRGVGYAARPPPTIRLEHGNLCRYSVGVYVADQRSRQVSHLCAVDIKKGHTMTHATSASMMTTSALSGYLCIHVKQHLRSGVLQRKSFLSPQLLSVEVSGFGFPSRAASGARPTCVPPTLASS